MQQRARNAIVALAFVLALAALATRAAPPQPKPTLTGDLEDEIVLDERYNGRAAAAAAANPRQRLPKLFDFENYKRLFAKAYSGLLEELARRKYFLSRAFRAFVSAVKYKYRQASYYLAVNSMSDYSPQELDAMRNRELEAMPVPTESNGGGSAALTQPLADELPELTLDGAAEDDDERRVEGELKRLVAAHEGEPGYEELRRLMNGASGAQIRRRNQWASAEGKRPRALPLERLINTGAEAELDAETAAKVAAQPPASDNPNYQAPELASFGLADEQRSLQIWQLNAKKRPRSGREQGQADSIASALWRSFDSIKSLGGGAGGGPVAQSGEPEDEVFLDLRDTKCFFLPRQQGSCGSCYAFAAITIVEWLYCMRTGKLVGFSEQYMIDCGNTYLEHLNGCSGGRPSDAGKFVQNFGLELRQKYPYQKRVDSCPYEPETELKKTGYIRFEFDDALMIHVDLMADMLKNGPILVGISCAPGFHEYGGGVHGHGCNQKKATHAVVLIGHGREEGQEYWLIRNSHSPGWGEGGYYKLAKAANCMPGKYGFHYATRDGVRLKPRIKKNLLNDQSAVERHYASNML